MKTNHSLPDLSFNCIPVYTKTICVIFSHWKNDKLKYAYKCQLAKTNLFSEHGVGHYWPTEMEETLAANKR